MECYCYLRNVHDKMADGKTAHEEHGCPARGKRQLQTHRFRKGESRLHQFGRRVLLGMFMDNVLHAGGGSSSDLLLADCEDVKHLSALENYVK